MGIIFNAYSARLRWTKQQPPFMLSLCRQSEVGPWIVALDVSSRTTRFPTIQQVNSRSDIRSNFGGWTTSRTTNRNVNALPNPDSCKFHLLVKTKCNRCLPKLETNKSCLYCIVKQTWTFLAAGCNTGQAKVRIISTFLNVLFIRMQVAGRGTLITHLL